MRRSFSLIVLSLLLTSMISIGSVTFAEPEVVNNVEIVEEPKIVSILNKVDEENAVPPTLKVIKVEVENKTEELEGEAGGQNPTTVLAFSEDGENILFDVNSPEYLAFQNAAIESIKAEAREGFELSRKNDSNVALDHLKLESWGEFIKTYDIESINNFPLQNISIEFGDYSFILEYSEGSKILVKDLLLPVLFESIKEVSQEYPIYRYALDIKSGALLSEYEFNIDEVRIVETLYPFDNVEKLDCRYTGKYFAITFSNEYFKVLEGYVGGVEGSTLNSIGGSKPGSVDVKTYVTLLKNVKGNTLSDKGITDFEIYEELAVRLDTKQLIYANDVTTDTVLEYKDFSLDEKALILTPIKDTVVILQPTYLECFEYKLNSSITLNKGMTRVLDITKFVSTGEPVLTVKGNESITIPLERFVNENGMVGTKLGNAPFLIYYSGKDIAYDRILEWIYSDVSTITGEDRETVVNKIKSDLISQNREQDFKDYMKAAGQSTSNLKTIILIVVVVVILLGLLIVFIVLKVSSNKRKNNPVGANMQGGLLFDDENSFDDDNDDDGGNFEFQ